MDNNQQLRLWAHLTPISTDDFQVLEELGVEKQRHRFYLGPSSQLATAPNVLTIPPVALATDRPSTPSDHTTA